MEGKSKNQSKYFVYCAEKGMPKKGHCNLADAGNEAKRLCQMEENRGYEFFVLRAVSSIRYSESPFITRQYSKNGD